MNLKNTIIGDKINSDITLFGARHGDASSALNSKLALSPCTHRTPLPSSEFLFKQLSTMADDTVLPIPNLELPQHHFTLMQPNLGHLHQNALKELLAGIEKDRMSIFPLAHS